MHADTLRDLTQQYVSFKNGAWYTFLNRLKYMNLELDSCSTGMIKNLGLHSTECPVMAFLKDEGCNPFVEPVIDDA